MQEAGRSAALVGRVLVSGRLLDRTGNQTIRGIPGRRAREVEPDEWSEDSASCCAFESSVNLQHGSRDGIQSVVTLASSYPFLSLLNMSGFELMRTPITWSDIQFY